MNYPVRLILILLSLLFMFFIAAHLSLGNGIYLVEHQEFVYTLSLFAVVLTITAPALRRASLPVSLLIWTVVYNLGKSILVRAEPTPAFATNYGYLSSIVETAYIWLMVGVAYRLGNGLQGLQQDIETFILKDAGGRIRTIDESIPDIQTELARSRRYHHPMSLIIIEPLIESMDSKLNHAWQNIQQTMIKRYTLTKFGRLIWKTLRRPDILMEQEEYGRFIIVCPETDAASSQELLRRIHAVSSKQLGMQVAAEIRDFPGGMLTLEEMMHHLESPMQPSVALSSSAVWSGSPDQTRPATPVTTD